MLSIRSVRIILESPVWDTQSCTIHILIEAVLKFGAVAFDFTLVHFGSASSKGMFRRCTYICWTAAVLDMVFGVTTQSSQVVAEGDVVQFGPSGNCMLTGKVWRASNAGHKRAR